MFEIMTTNGLGPHTLLQGKTYRKEIIKYGTFRHPNPFLTDDPEFDFTFDRSQANLMISNFNKGLVDSVKLLQIHDEELGKIVGVVKGLSVTDTGVDMVVDIEDDETILGLEKRDSDGNRIGPGVSVGMDMNFPIAEANSRTSRAEGPVLRHVALATIPWISGMRDWETVEARLAASSINYNFGHEDYTGIPLIPEEGVKGVDKKTLREAIKILASNQGKTEEEMARLVGVSLEEDKKLDLTPELAAVLASLVGATTKPADDDKTVKLPESSEAVAEAERLVAAAIAPIAEGLRTLTTQLSASQQAVKETQDQIANREAEEAASNLIKAGKVLPANKATYIALHKSNKELFTEISAALPVVAPPFNAEGGTGQEPSSTMNMSSEQVAENIDRYAKMITPSDAGKRDTVSGREGR